MEFITSGRDLRCKDLQGGVAKVYLLPYVKWIRSQVSIIDMELVLAPSSDYYLFEVFGNVVFTQSMQENEGGKFYNYNFELKIDAYPQIHELINSDFRAVITDRQNNSRMVGLWNGLKCESINKQTGSSKADFSGLTLRFEGQEILEAPYINIDILNESYLLQENSYYLLQENLGKFII